MTDLRPCPFCGENGEEIQDRSYYLPNNIYIGIFYCRNCGGAMIDTDKNHCWLDRAKLWNNRFCTDVERKPTQTNAKNQCVECALKEVW